MQHYMPRKNGDLRIVTNRSMLECQYGPDTAVVLGGGSSELVGGAWLGEVLQPAAALLHQQAQLLTQGRPAPPTVLHTSLGLSSSLPGFLRALAPHVPATWQRADEWGVLLQAEGSSAVAAAVHALQQRARAPGVAVAACSYHGPPSAAYGSRQHGQASGKPAQLLYPAPAPNQRRQAEPHEAFMLRIEREQLDWLDAHPEVGVLLIEPQWGSAACGQPWPQTMLQRFVARARELGILVCADEIMCGMGRHGQGHAFLVEAWQVEVDAIVWGKAAAAGSFPLAGALLRCWDRAAGVHTHTYAHGAHPLALLTATQVLARLPSWHGAIAERARIMATELSGTGATGQGLLWGIPHAQPANLLQACRQSGIQVYAIPDGILLTPLINADPEQLRAALRRLVAMLGQKRNPPCDVVFPHRDSNPGLLGESQLS